jgi:hypothetical protein
VSRSPVTAPHLAALVLVALAAGAIAARADSGGARRVSIVPDGVSAAFLTAPDGTAVRADVKDNAYEFLVPRPRVLEQRYVVWTGGDGTPHVQPVLAVGVLREPCATGSRSCRGRRGSRRWATSGHARRRRFCRRRSRPRPPGAIGSGASASPCPRSPPTARRWPRSRCRRRRSVSGRLPSDAELRRGPAPGSAGSLGGMAAPRSLVVLTLLAVTAAAVSVTILVWISIGTSNDLNRVVDKANRVADDASRSVDRLDRTTRELDPAIRSLRRAADALRQANTAAP